MADFGTTPLSDTVLAVNTFPVCTVYVPNTAGSNLTATEGGPASTDGNSKTSAPVSVYVKDGSDVAQGTTTDVAVTGDNPGTQAAKLRGLNKVLASVWDSPNHWLQVKVMNATSLGQATMQNSAPVAIASDQTTLPVSGTVNAGTGTFTNQQSNVQADYDTTAGTQNLTMFGMALPASGGAVAGGTSSNPLRTDPTGTTTQPVSGTVTANQGGSNWSTNTVQLNGTTIDTNSGTKSAGTQRVVLATDQPALTNALKVDGSAVTQPVSGTITANAGTGNFNDASVGASGAAVPASASYLGGNKGGNLTGISLDGSGNLNVNVAAGGASGGTSSSFNATFPATGTATGASDGTNMKPLLVDASGFLKVNISAGGASGGTSSSFGSAFPATGTASGFSDGTNMQGARAFDADTGAGTQYVAGANLRISSSGGSIEAKGQQTMTNSIPVTLASDQGAVPVSGTFWQATQPVSGTITANAGTGPFPVAGMVASGASNANNPVKVGGAFNTTQPTVTTGQVVDAQYSARGAALVATGADTFNVTVNAALPTGSNVIGHVIADSGSTTAVTQTTASNLNAQVQGAAASGAAQSGNPVKVGGVFNTTQPTVTTGQAVDAQYTARGASIVATGTDTFNVTVNAALPTGGNTIGAVTQASGPWTSNVTQINSSAIVTAATGVQKVGIVGNAGATVDSTVAAGTAPTNALVTGAVYNSSAPAPTSGQSMALQVDQAGNMRLFPGMALGTLSAWNSSTALNTTQNIFTNSGAQAVLVQLTQTTTITAGAITYEVSYDGSNWLTIPAGAVLDPTSSTFAQISLPYTLQASTNKQFLLNMNGAQGLRIKLSTQITGTGAVTPNYALLPASPADTVVALSPTAANFNVTASAGTNLNTSLLALESGGHLANIDTHTPALGSAVSASSSPVVIASDQAAVASKRSTVAVYSLASAATTSSSNSGDLTVGPYTEISIDINTTAKTGTNPTIQFTYSRKGADGIYYALWQSTTINNVAANTISTSIGAGMAYNQSLGATGQLSWVIGGSATPGYTFSANISGK